MISRPTRSLVRYLVLGACAGMLAACQPHRDRGEASRTATSTAGGGSSDVVLVTVDTLRADRLGFMGYEAARTPRLDGLADEGVVFTQALTPIPRTTPGIASLMTGSWPQHHGSREVGDPIVAGVLLAERLQAAGYRTVAVSANSTAGPDQGLAAGFEEFVDYDMLVATHEERLYRDLTDVPPTAIGWAEAVTSAALEQLASRADDRPLFLWVFYFDPHFLYRPPSPWQDDVDAAACWDLYAWGLKDRARGSLVFNDHDGLATRVLPDCSALYDAEIAYVDHEIGRLLDGLAVLRPLDEAQVVFTADHGENLGEGGLFFEHGDNAHDAGLRVPLVFRGPGARPGLRHQTPVSLVDVAPTILSRLGLDALESADGTDLSAALAGEPDALDPSRVVFAESATSMSNAAFQHVTTGRRGFRTCVNDPPYTLCRGGRDPAVYRLHDHRHDPLLRTDLSAQHPDVVARLLAAWEAWPAESARYRVARSGRYKLVQSPLLAGGYSTILVDLMADPSESIDVSARYADRAVRLQTALESWASDIGSLTTRGVDEDLERRLRALGYVR